MKAITLTQPWAQLVAIGAKRIETRSWNTNYRGPLAIHAAKGFPESAKDKCYQRFFQGALIEHGFKYARQLPIGVIIATCELVHVKQVTESEWFPACKAYAWKKRIWHLDNQERAFGDFSVGRYMWLFENVVMLDEPIPAKGALGLWEWIGV